MGDAYIEYRVSLLRRYRVPIVAGIVAGLFATVVAVEGSRDRPDELFGLLYLICMAFALVMWVKGEHPLSVKLSPSGIERCYARHKRLYTPWHDVEAVDVKWRSTGSREVKYPVLVLKDGREIRIGAIITSARPVTLAEELIVATPRDPRFEEKVSEMRRLLAEARDLEWSEPDAPAIDEAEA